MFNSTLFRAPAARLHASAGPKPQPTSSRGTRMDPASTISTPLPLKGARNTHWVDMHTAP